MKIDCQSHLFPSGYAEALTRNPGSPRTIGGAGRYSVTYGDMQSFKLDLDDYSVERKLRDMDAAGIDWRFHNHARTPHGFALRKGTPHMQGHFVGGPFLQHLHAEESFVSLTFLRL